jgi:hypothetical protein
MYRFRTGRGDETDFFFLIIPPLQHLYIVPASKVPKWELLFCPEQNRIKNYDKYTDWKQYKDAWHLLEEALETKEKPWNI